MILTRDGRVPYRIRFWWAALRIFLRDAWRRARGLKSSSGLRWQFEATYRAVRVTGPANAGDLMAWRDDGTVERFSYYEPAPTITYTPSRTIDWERDTDA